MERLYYEVPTLERKKEALEYIQEHYEYNSPINGSGGLDRYLENYEEWLLKIEEDRTKIPTEERVPAETYFLVRESDDKIVGMVNIRLTLNERLKQSGGHIGYGIRPTERHKGYNKVNLYLALEVCASHGIEEVMLSCVKENIASSKTMLALGAKKEKEFEENRIVMENYKIKVQESLEKFKDTYETQIIKKR